MISTTPTSYLRPIGQLQERIFYFMLATLFVVMIAAAVALLFYLMPPPSDLYVGRLDQFPPAEAPYVLDPPDKPPVFIVNDGNTLVAMSGIGTHLFHCRLVWRKRSFDSDESRRATFEDPCAGGGFALNGGYLDGPSPRHMDHLKLRVDGANRVYVDPQTRLVDSKEEVYARCLAAQQWRYGNQTVRYDSKEFCVGYTNSYIRPQGAS